MEPPNGLDFLCAMLAILDRLLMPDFGLSPAQRAKVERMRREALSAARECVRQPAERGAAWLN